MAEIFIPTIKRILTSSDTFRFVVFEVSNEVVLNFIVNKKHRFTLQFLFAILHILLSVFLGNIDAVMVSKLFHGLDEIHIIVFHHEADSVATLIASPKAMPGITACVHYKGRSLFIMKRATTFIVRPRFFELHNIANHINDVGTVNDLVDNRLVHD